MSNNKYYEYWNLYVGAEETKPVPEKKAETKSFAEEYKQAYSYYKGDGVPKNIPEAVKIFKRLAEHGYLTAQSMLGNCYYKGEGVEKNYVEALKWYKKAAEQGGAVAHHNIGVFYEYGYAVEKDLVEALQWYEIAVKKGYADAQAAVDRVKKIIDESDPSKPPLLTEFVKLGNNKFRYDKCRVSCVEDVVRAMEAGYLFKNIIYPEGQEKQLFTHLVGAAIDNDYAAVAYAYCVSEGVGTAKNPTGAIPLLGSLSAGGNVVAQNMLGYYCYDEGNGVTQNYPEAVKWYQKAAEQ